MKRIIFCFARGGAKFLALVALAALIAPGAPISTSAQRRRAAANASPSAARRPPNVIIIYADDLGYGDLSSFGARAIKTPHLDRLAREGIKLTSFYSVAPVCTPSRAGLMTGRYPARMGIEQMRLNNVLFPTDKTGLPQNETTLARALKGRGYRTACVGKWHLGHLAPHRPIDHGFDSYFGIPYSNDMKPTTLVRDAEVVEETAQQETLTKRYTEESVRFIEGAKDGPFFLYLAHNMPHIPLYASEAFRGKSAGGLYGDVVEELDWGVGQITATLRRLNLDRDTIVIFASDNGPWYQGSPGPLRGRKGTTNDGGVRVPGIVRWTGHIRAGSVSDEPLATIDLFPTLLHAAGETNPAAATKQPLDGKNVLPVLLGARDKSPDELLVFFDGPYLQTARAGRWKIHVARWDVPRYTAASNRQKNLRWPRSQLYDLTSDANESYDVALDRPEVVRELEAKIAAALRTFPAEIQAANSELLK